MDLIGTLDSPYVRRVAISLEYYGIRYRHKPISVFDSFDEFAKINPVVKAPTIVLDDGGVLLNSSLILDYFERQNHTGRRLMPDEPLKQARAVRTIGLALAVCEKAIQIIYERKMRPLDKQYEPWVDRITAQLLAAFRELDYEIDSQNHRQTALLSKLESPSLWRGLLVNECWAILSWKNNFKISTFM